MSDVFLARSEVRVLWSQEGQEDTDKVSEVPILQRVLVLRQAQALQLPRCVQVQLRAILEGDGVAVQPSEGEPAEVIIRDLLWLRFGLIT